MDTQIINNIDDVDEIIRSFLRNNPQAKQALDIFGITFENYKKYLNALNEPFFYTSISTVEGGSSGELD